MKKKLKKLTLPSLVITGSVFYSTTFAIGAALAYFAIEIILKKWVNTGKFKMLIFDYKRWQIHLHHWLIAVLIMFGIYLSGSISLSIFWTGALIGVIFHDIYTDKKWRNNNKNWYHIIYKKPSA